MEYPRTLTQLKDLWIMRIEEEVQAKSIGNVINKETAKNIPHILWKHAHQGTGEL
jgi:hypothetical protein